MDDNASTDAARDLAFAERQLGRPLTQAQARVFLESVRVSNQAAERQARRCVRIEQVSPVKMTMQVENDMADALSYSLAGIAAMRAPKRRWDEERVTRVLSWVVMIAAYLLAAGFILALVAQWWGSQ